MKKNSIFLLLLAICSVAIAQEPLSLNDAISLGLQRNYGILIENKNIEIAKNNNNSGEAGKWPTITFNVNQNNSVTDNVKVANPFQLQGPISSNSVNPSINLNWVLFDGFSVKMTKRRLDQLQAETEGNASIVIANTIQSIILGYYVAVLENERLEEFQKQLQLSRDKYEYLKVKSEIGSAVTTDLLLEEGNYLTDSINFINQQLAFRSAIRNLNVLLSETEMTKEYTLLDSLEIPLELYAYDDLRAKMIQENVDIKRQYITQSLLGTATKLAESDKYPTLTFNSGFSENRGRSNLSNTNRGADFPDPLSAVTDNYFANFTLSFTLFNGGRINRSIKNALVSEDIGQLRIDQMENSLDRDLLTAIDRYNIRRQLYEINNRREAVAKINLQLSESKFSNGTINSFDYREVQNNYLSASILKLQSIYNLIDSKIELMRLTGGLIQEYN
jgi:outer membrane protein TolC